jgi:glycosyltransferase involved in cell wall biosynthesis
MKDVTIIPRIEVDVIIPVFNSAEFLRETVASAMHQIWAIPNETPPPPDISVHVCCYNDGSTDESWRILQELHTEYNHNSRHDVPDDPLHPKKSIVQDNSNAACWPIPSKLYIESGSQSRGAGYARNRAVAMRAYTSTHVEEKEDNVWRFLCWLDSDDIMEESRVCHQIQEFMSMSSDDRETTLLGCRFDRIPVGSTWHYTQWANTLDDKRIYLERFREVTLLQPTWMMSRKRFKQLGGYLEAPLLAQSPAAADSFNVFDWLKHSDDIQAWRLVHRYDTATTLRLAEDLRFFHEHLAQNGKLRRCPTDYALVTYRHHNGSSQSSQTPRKLLLSLRVAAMEKSVLQQDRWQQFLIWGAGRDGKDFVKALSPRIRSRVYCFLEVDDQKIARGFYQYRYRVNGNDTNERNDVDVDIPILHFSLAVLDPQVRNSLYSSWKNGSANLGKDSTSTPVAREKKYEASSAYGQIDKTNYSASIESTPPPTKRSKTTKTKNDQRPRQDPGRSVIDVGKIAQLPVVVCVALHRTNGALEHNVRLIDRTEGHDLWHFS